MVKTSNTTPKAKTASAVAGSGGVAGSSSKGNVSSPGSAKMPKFKKRKANGNRTKAAVAAQAAQGVIFAGTAGGDTPALTSVPNPSTVTEASPVASVPKPVTVGEGSTEALTPNHKTDEASVPDSKPKLTDPAAATNNGVGADNTSVSARKKRQKERNRERAMNRKGKEKEEEIEKGKVKENHEEMKKKGKEKEERSKKVDGGYNKGGGLIFMCNAQTKPECFKNRVFGLPMGKSKMVEKIRPGTKLFLYDFDLKLLYGVYKASSKGGVNLVRNAFNGKFPAQVKFKIDKDCLPLPESTFKHAIKENYMGKSKFNPELNSTHVRGLLALFKDINVPQSAPKVQYERSLGERHNHEERRQLHQYSLAHVQNDHTYYQQALPSSESRYLPLGLDPGHLPLALEPHHMPSVLEPQHVPPVYYHHLASSSNDLYYRPRLDPAHERITARTPPRDYAALPGELSARAGRVEDLYRHDEVASRGAHLQDLYRSGDIAANSAHVEDTYRLGEIAAHGARVEDTYRPVEFASRGARVEDPYRSVEFASRGAHMEDSYRPGEFAARGARAEDPYRRAGEVIPRGSHGELYRVGEIIGHADRAEGLYRSDQLVTRVVELPRHSNSTIPAYAEASQRSLSARANASGVPVSSLYSFSVAPAYR